jgi:hypothetical protein
MKKTAPIPFAGSQLDETRHVCAFFNSDEEEYRVLLPFIKDGFECGHKAVHVVNPEQRDDHLNRLIAAGIDTAGAAQSGQFELKTNTEAYLRTHPMVIIGGILQHNPFFVPPEQFLPEFRERRARQAAARSTAV